MINQRALAVIAAAVLLGCGDGKGTPTGPTAGSVDVVISTPNADDAGFLIVIGGTANSFTPASGVQGFQQESGGIWHLAVVASGSFPAGDVTVGRLSVPDVEASKRYGVSLSEVATSQFQVRSSLGGYAVHLR